MSPRESFVAEVDDRLDRVVASQIEALSRSRAAALVKQGVVQVAGEVWSRPSARVRAGMEVSVDVPEPVPDAARPQDLPIRIVHEDEHLVIVDKAPGMVVHPGAGHPDGTLVNALLHHVGDLSGIGGVARPGIVHRLDRGTSGLMVVAKHDRAHRSLAEQFAEKRAGRLYLALCLGAPELRSGTIESFVARHPTQRLRWASTDGSYGKRALTYWRLRGQAHGMSLIECRLGTGRTHQVRVHLTEQGWPLAGDDLYRRRDRMPWSGVRDGIAALGSRPLLHAWSLTLTHPASGRKETWTAPVAPDFQGILEALDLVDALPYTA